MKTMKYLGCLLALVFAGASAFAGVWFVDSVGQDLPITRWYTTTKGTSVSSDEWVWTTGAQGELSYGSYNNWTTPLTYEAEQSQSLAAKDSTITTSVKFTAMDIEDLNDQNKQGIGSDVKGGLTVVEDLTADPTLSYYGIVDVNGVKEWKPLTGADPTLEAFVDVTVELKNNLNNTYTITYKVGGEALTVASGSSFTMATANGATISKVEYLGQFSLESLAGATWYNPVEIDRPTDVIATAKVGGNVVTDWAKFPRGAAISFSFVAKDKYSLENKNGSAVTLDGENQRIEIDWNNYYETAMIPDVPGAPSKITVDKAVVEERLADGAKDDGMGYLYTQQDNGQLGWVNVTLGIADNASAKIAAQPVEQLDTDAVVLDFNLGENKKAYYSIGGTSNDVPAIALGETKAANNRIVKVDVVVQDEAGVDHVIATKDVGIMEAGKDTTGATKGTMTFDIVGVPWGSMDADAKTVSLDELLNKSLLTPGDKVYIKKGDDYDTYTLTEDGEENRFWEKAAAAKGRSSLAAATTTTAPELSKGDALWIEHDVGSHIVFSGAAVTQPDSKKASAPATKGEEAWSLIANTSLKPLALSTITPSGANDRIIVETIGAPIQYEYQNSVWGYYEKQKVNGRNKLVWVPGKSIPAGTGFWYVNTGTADVTISFPSNVDQPAAD